MPRTIVLLCCYVLVTAKTIAREFYRTVRVDVKKTKGSLSKPFRECVRAGWAGTSAAFILLFSATVLVQMACRTPASLNNSSLAAGDWYMYNDNLEVRWSSPENLNGFKGSGGSENRGAKGHPFDAIEAGGSQTLLDVQGQGIVNRIWLTINDRSPEMLRSLRIEMYWDNEEKPAVSVPLGDFFGVGLGRTARFYNALFANPEGKSFNSYIPMPFKKAAKIRILNESGKRLSHLFFDVNFQMLKEWDDRYMYFHACWQRDTLTTLAKDFELLPRVNGKGRFMGVNVGVLGNSAYKRVWWGEGEVKIYLNGDKDLPTLVGTGTEDYIGTGWSLGEFFNPYTGSLVADGKNNQWAFYRYHIPDPIFFETDCRVTLQQIGGGPYESIKELQQEAVPLIPVTVDDQQSIIRLFEKDSSIADKDRDWPKGWTNIYRSDDVSATAYFYLDKPVSNLPVLQPLHIRTYKMNKP